MAQCTHRHGQMKLRGGKATALAPNVECDANPSIDTWTAAMERSQLGDPKASHSEAKSTVSESACKHEPSGTLAHGEKLVLQRRCTPPPHPCRRNLGPPRRPRHRTPRDTSWRRRRCSSFHVGPPVPSASTSNRQGAGPNTQGDGEGFTAPSSWHPDNVPGGASSLGTWWSRRPFGPRRQSVRRGSLRDPCAEFAVSAVPHPISVLPLARRMALPWAGA